jgi:hypothetical protein
VNSSTSSSKRWLQIFFAIIGPVCVGYLVASEWLIRTEVLPRDSFEWISARLRNSTQSNAAFGDSHVAAVPDFNTRNFVNLGVGATTIRKMDQRVRYYFSKIKPGEVIIEADPHLFAEYRLQAQASYVRENYSEFRLRVLDPQHRGFMTSYWTAFLSKGRLEKKEDTAYDRLWDAANKLQSETAGDSEAPKPSKIPQGLPPAAPMISQSATHQPVSDQETLAKFNAFMDYEVAAHTPVLDFRSRDEARIYQDMIRFLIAGGAKVCLVNYPVDRYYRERADTISLFTQVHEFYKQIARENHIPYVSFWARFDDPSMFQNTDHVNQNGSPILAREARQACFGRSE